MVCLYVCEETGRFDTESFQITPEALKLHKNFDLFTYTEFARGQENIWGKYPSFFKSSTWSHLHLDQVNVYRNDL